MSIPEKALLEAVKALFREYGETCGHAEFSRIRTILEAAQPILVEQATASRYDKGWDDCRTWHQGGTTNIG